MIREPCAADGRGSRPARLGTVADGQSRTRSAHSPLTIHSLAPGFAPERLASMGHTARVRIVEDFNRKREVEEIVAVYRRLWEAP